MKKFIVKVRVLFANDKVMELNHALGTDSKGEANLDEIVGAIRLIAYQSVAQLEKQGGAYVEWKAYVEHPFDWMVHGRVENDQLRLRFQCLHETDNRVMDKIHMAWQLADLANMPKH